MIVPAVLLAPLPYALDERLAPELLAARALRDQRRSTCVWVAIPAWSVPKIHFVRWPRIRWRRISVSMIASWKAWPMCSDPVTFGGGIAIE